MVAIKSLDDTYRQRTDIGVYLIALWLGKAQERMYCVYLVNKRRQIIVYTKVISTPNIGFLSI